MCIFKKRGEAIKYLMEKESKRVFFCSVAKEERKKERNKGTQAGE